MAEGGSPSNKDMKIEMNYDNKDDDESNYMKEDKIIYVNTKK